MKAFLVLMGLFVASSALSRTPLKYRLPDKDGIWRNQEWMCGTWSDHRANAGYAKLRRPIDALLARNRGMDTNRIKTLVEAYRRRFGENPCYETLFSFIYVCGKYPKYGRKNIEIYRDYLFKFQSPNCFEYARAAFLAVVNVDDDYENFSTALAARFKPYAEGDWLLTEALIKLYSNGSKFSKADRRWAYEVSKRLSETMPDGTYGFGHLRLDAAWPLMSSDAALYKRELAYLDNMIHGNFFAKADIPWLQWRKDLLLSWKRRK